MVKLCGRHLLRSLTPFTIDVQSGSYTELSDTDRRDGRYSLELVRESALSPTGLLVEGNAPGIFIWLVDHDVAAPCLLYWETKDYQPGISGFLRGPGDARFLFKGPAYLAREVVSQHDSLRRSGAPNDEVPWSRRIY